MRKCILLTLLGVLVPSCTVFLDTKGELIPAIDEPVVIPFSTWEDAILIEAEIHGQKGVFLFDNGFTNSAVSPEFARRAKIGFDESVTTTDMNNRKQELPMTVVDRVTIQGQAFVNTRFHLLDTKVFSPCTHLDGIVGASIINLINWEIDYPSLEIRLSSRPFDEDGHKLNVEYSNNNSAFTSIRLNDISVRTKIDFGKISDELTLNLENTFEYFKGFEAVENTGVRSISAHGLGSPISFYELAEKVPISADGTNLPVASKTSLVENLKYGGFLGAGYFRNYEKVVINSTIKEFILVGPDYHGSTSFGESKSYGISLYEVDNTWQVVQLNSHDPLFNEVDVSDEVLLLDGEPISSFRDMCEYKDYLKAKEETEGILKITLVDGVEYEVPLAKPKTAVLK